MDPETRKAVFTQRAASEPGAVIRSLHRKVEKLEKERDEALACLQSLSSQLADKREIIRKLVT